MSGLCLSWLKLLNKGRGFPLQNKIKLAAALNVNNKVTLQAKKLSSFHEMLSWAPRQVGRLAYAASRCEAYSELPKLQCNH